MSDRVMKSTNMPAAFRNARYSDYDRRRGNPDLIEQLENWTPTDSHPSVLLVGAPGLAKTLLACATLNELQVAHCPRAAAQTEKIRTVLMQERWPVYFIPLAAYIDLQLRMFRLHDDNMKRNIDPTEYLEIDKLLEDLKYRVQALVVDDVGKEHRTSSGFAEDAFDLLVRIRHNRGLPTVYTSNVPLRRWSAQYSDSMQNLMERASLVLEFQTRPTTPRTSRAPDRQSRKMRTI